MAARVAAHLLLAVAGCRAASLKPAQDSKPDATQNDHVFEHRIHGAHHAGLPFPTRRLEQTKGRTGMVRPPHAQNY